jgi:hypothetical protein
MTDQSPLFLWNVICVYAINISGTPYHQKKGGIGVNMFIVPKKYYFLLAESWQKSYLCIPYENGI